MTPNGCCRERWGIDKHVGGRRVTHGGQQQPWWPLSRPAIVDGTSVYHVSSSQASIASSGGTAVGAEATRRENEQVWPKYRT